MTAELVARLDETALDASSRSRWELRSTLPGRTVLCVATDSATGEVFSASPTGVVSRGGGTKWEQVGQPLPLVQVVSAGAGSRSRVWAGALDGLYEWEPAAGRWQRKLDVPWVTSIAVPEIDADVAVVGTRSDGVYRTSDGGTTWTSSSAGLLDLAVDDLISTGFRAGQLAAATSSGVYLSENAGRSWCPVDMDAEDEVATHGLAAIGATLVVATDDGVAAVSLKDATWSWLSHETGSVSSVCAVDDICVVAGGTSAWMGGASTTRWTRSAPLPSTCHGLAAHSGSVLAATRRHGVLAMDAAAPAVAGWTPYGTFPVSATGQLLSLSGTIFWGGLESGLVRSEDRGRTWTPLPAADNDVVDFAVDAQHGVIASTTDGLVPVDGSDRTALIDQPTGPCAWLPDGSAITAFPGSTVIQRWSPTSRTAETLGELPGTVTQLCTHGDSMFATALSDSDGWAETSISTVWFAPRPGSSWRPLVSTKGGARAVLHADGRGLTAVIGDVVLATADVGATSLARVGTLRADSEAPTVAFSLTGSPSGDLFAVTSCGVQISADRGRSWDTLSIGPGVLATSVCAVTGSLLAVDTTGNVWRLDDLEAYKEEVAASGS